MRLRNERKRPIVAFLVFLALMLVGASCGGDPAPQAEGGTDQETQPAPQATQPEEPEDEAEVPTEEPTEEVFSLEGERIDFVVGFSPGGGYDSYARLIAPYLAYHTGATVVVQNEDGASGRIATNRTFQAEGNWRRIQIIDVTGSVGAQLGGADGVEFDLAQFNWLGRVQTEPSLVLVGPDSEFSSFQGILDANPRPARFGLVGPGGQDFITFSVLQAAYGFDAEAITGFPGSAEQLTAILRGDVDAVILSVSRVAENIEDGDLVPLGAMSSERVESLPDVPAIASEFVPTEADGDALLAAHSAVFELYRAVVAPPGVEDGPLQALRDGLLAALNDPDLIAEGAQSGLGVTPLPGDEAQVIAERLVNEAPDIYREVLAQD